MFKVFPSTITPDRRKIPIIPEWKTKATTDAEQLRLWSELYRDRLSHWGIATGPINGILVLDIDVKNNGFENVKRLGLHIPDTMKQRTISGGMHYVYRYPQDGKVYGNRVGLFEKGSGIDIRGADGYVFHYGLDATPIADAPDWLLKEALRAESNSNGNGSAIGVHPKIAETIIVQAIEAIRCAGVGERNNTLNKEAFKIAQLVASGSITREYAEAILINAGKEVGLNAFEIKATVASALKGGIAKPLTSVFDGAPTPAFEIPAPPVSSRWTPEYFTRQDLTDFRNLRRPQLFQDWSTEDIHITTADGGTGKTTLMLYEAICLALGERFLGFNCLQPGKTLFITGEDTALKLGAMIGAIIRQMGILNDPARLEAVLASIVVKKDPDLCLIVKDKQGFLHPNTVAMNRIFEAVHDIKPKMIVFDPISSFWGSEAALNDMAKAVSRFMSTLTEASQACVVMINHMGKVSSKDKDMSQFAGRGGTGLPSHARVSRVLRPVFEEEFKELTGNDLKENQSAMMCNVGKFTDGSPLYNKPFLILREGYLFSRVTLEAKAQMDARREESDMERVFNYIKEMRRSKKYPTKPVVIAHFQTNGDPLSVARVGRALDMLLFEGFNGELLKSIEHPDATERYRAYVVTDDKGREKD